MHSKRTNIWHLHHCLWSLSIWVVGVWFQAYHRHPTAHRGTHMVTTTSIISAIATNLEMCTQENNQKTCLWLNWWCTSVYSQWEDYCSRIHNICYVPRAHIFCSHDTPHSFDSVNTFTSGKNHKQHPDITNQNNFRLLSGKVISPMGSKMSAEA